jgi:ABC-2 type transport system ATP-binding protein
MADLLQKLQTESFLLDVKHAIQEIPILKNFHLQKIGAKTLEVEIPKTISINELFTELSQHNIEVISMRNKVGRLEELFIKLTAENHEQN